MTTYTLVGTPGTYQWSDPTSWVGGIVPNGPTADVVFPVVTSTSTGQPVGSTVDLNSGSYVIRSLAVNSSTLGVTGGSLTVSNPVTIATGGGLGVDSSLFVTSLSNQGAIQQDYYAGGQITSTGAVTNSGAIGTPRLDPNVFTPTATNIKLTLTAASFSNTGSVTGVLIDTPVNGFTNLRNGTLSGGSYYDIALNVGAVIVTDAADLTLSYDPTASSYDASPADEEVDPASGTYLPIENTLRTVAASGSLTTGSYTTSSLTVDGVLKANGTFTAGHLTIDAGGSASMYGSVVGAVTNNGRIGIASYAYPTLISINTSYQLVIDGPVTGNGSLEISASFQGNEYNPAAMLELKQAASNNVVFDDQYGTLLLDQPGSFTGIIKAAGEGDQIILAGVALSSIASKSYVSTASGGTLTLTETNGTTLAYRFVGNNLTGSSFLLSAGPQPYSTSTPSLVVTVDTAEQTGNAFYIDGSQGVQNLVGTGNPNFINTAGAAGTGTVVVDLQRGLVTKGGQTDAVFKNIQGVQLGADPSDVTSLLSGTDLIYGGSGTLTFHSTTTVTDYIQGGPGTNIIFGEGTEIFYGNGGHDVMRGSDYGNYMSGGSTPQSTDVFYGTYGNDFVYGHGGAVDLVGGLGNEYLSAGSGFNEIDDRQQPGGTPNVGLSQLVGSTGIDLFYGGIGTNLIVEGSGTDTFVGSAGADTIDGGSGRSFTYAGGGTDVVNTGSGNDYVKAGTGKLTFNDTAANLQAGRFDYIDNFAGAGNTDLYLPTGFAGATSFVSQNGGTAVLTAVGGGTAEIFAAGADAGMVQAHTHFTLGAS